MMRIVSAIFGVPLFFVLLSFVLSNRLRVELTLWPLSLPFRIEVPVYSLAIAGLLVGLVTGGLIVWWGTFSYRQQARKANRRVAVLEQELALHAVPPVPEALSRVP